MGRDTAKRAEERGLRVRGLTPEDEKRVLEAHERTTRPSEIERMTGIWRLQVTNVLRKYGIGSEMREGTEPEAPGEADVRDVKEAAAIVAAAHTRQIARDAALTALAVVNGVGSEFASRWLPVCQLFGLDPVEFMNGAIRFFVEHAGRVGDLERERDQYRVQAQTSRAAETKLRGQLFTILILRGVDPVEATRMVGELLGDAIAPRAAPLRLA